MIFCEDSYPKILDEISRHLTKGDIELVFVGSKTMQEINKKERNIDKTTDVLSFPYEKVPNCPLGSLVINSDLAFKKSKELKHSLDDEIALLFIHGLLHILGYDHEVDNGQMREKEKELIEKFALPKSLIIRNE